jgi:predicted pyridoxine 5'-phosphate oxidase superfamily flavin-nucleotide-binding protein
MAHRFSELTFTPAVESIQQHFGSFEKMQQMRGRMPDFDRLRERECAFISQRDSFYMATVSENDWPYIQHRGGPLGFLQIINDRCLAFANYRGNSQYQTLGNSTHNNKVALFLVDYANKRRLKILGRMRIHFLDDLSERLKPVMDYCSEKERVESIIEIELEAFDWNCSQYLTPRFSEEQLLELGVIKQGDLT